MKNLREIQVDPEATRPERRTAAFPSMDASVRDSKLRLNEHKLGSSGKIRGVCRRRRGLPRAAATR